MVNIYILKFAAALRTALIHFRLLGLRLSSISKPTSKWPSTHLSATALTLRVYVKPMKDLRYASIVLDFRIPGSHSCTPGPLCEDTLLWMVACILLDSLGTNLEAIASIWRSLVTSCPLLGLFVRTHSILVAPPGRRDGSGSWKRKLMCLFYRFSLRIWRRSAFAPAFEV